VQLPAATDVTARLPAVTDPNVTTPGQPDAVYPPEYPGSLMVRVCTKPVALNERDVGMAVSGPGVGVGTAVGADVGDAVGADVGADVGMDVGAAVGDPVGAGDTAGVEDPCDFGDDEAAGVGDEADADGEGVGAEDGRAVGVLLDVGLGDGVSGGPNAGVVFTPPLHAVSGDARRTPATTGSRVMHSPTRSSTVVKAAEKCEKAKHL
jgi:hypothetical protein